MDFEGLSALKIGNTFKEGSSLTFKAVITDLAGNERTTDVYSTALVVDQTRPVLDGLKTGDVVTDAEDDDDVNIVSGYCNMHNTGLQVTVPLPDDESLVGGAVIILGKKEQAPQFLPLGLNSVTSNSQSQYNALYDIDSDEYDNSSTTVPSTGTFLPDVIATGYRGVEEITDFEHDAVLAFAARVYDVAGNYDDMAESDTKLIVDLVHPYITEVTSLNPYIL